MENTPVSCANRVALFTIAVGRDPVYFDSVRRYFPYNKENFGQGQAVDYYLFTDRSETIEGIINIPCSSVLWPYAALLKNNMVAGYLNKEDKWNEYSHVFFIDADFAIGAEYDFFSPEFVLPKPYWNNKIGGGFFYGGKTECFRKLCSLFYEEIQFISENKLAVPRDLDEFYLGLFREQYEEQIHLIEMDRQTNTLIFYDNEDLDEKIRQQGKRLFMQPYKAEGRANKTMLTDAFGKEQECIVNLDEQYIFNNRTFDFGRLLQLDDLRYRILWSKQPERREVLNSETLKIWKQPAGFDSAQILPVISVVMPTHNTPPEYLKESIESVLKQTFADFELLITNDGSTETQGIDWIKTLQDPRVRLIENNHDFIASSNKGISESRGKYIARMDADDIMLPNRLATQYEFMEAHPEVDVCGSWIEMFGDGKDTIRLQTEHSGIITSLLLANQMAHPTTVLRKSSVCKDGTNIYKSGYDFAEDYKLWTDLAIRGLRFANIPEVLLLYRRHGEQVTQKMYKEMSESSLKLRVEYAEQVMQQIVEKEEAFYEYFERLIELLNKKLIGFNSMTNIIYQIYIDFYERH